MAMNPDAVGEPNTLSRQGEAAWEDATPPRSAPVEWEVIEQVPGDPWTAELVVWSGDEIDGLTIPLDETLMGAIGDLRRRQADIAALDHADPAEPQPPPEDTSRSRAGALLQGLGRSTGSTQADRWLAGVPVRLQIAGAAALLVVFVLVMVIGSLM